MALELRDITYKYSAGTAYEITALDHINVTFPDGEFIGIIGHTGSGKSTLVQHLNGLIKATSGEIIYNGQNIYDPNYSMKELRTQVGMVFQYPEHQLFETTVYDDVAFGPKNQGLDDKDVALRTYEALEAVGFPQELCDVSPFELSGG
jgi:energy-coupling factor transport system ATP-binding protein